MTASEILHGVTNYIDLVAAALNLEPSHSVVFEDAIAGLEAAHRAGMKCIGVGDQKTLTEADRVIPGFVNVNLSLLQL